MPKVTFHEEADSEMREAALYYEERAPGLGLAFLDEVEKTVQCILAHPVAYRRVAAEIRQALVTRFPYGILYVTEPGEHIRIVTVAHLKRRPGYWWKRLFAET